MEKRSITEPDVAVKLYHTSSSIAVALVQEGVNAEVVAPTVVPLVVELQVIPKAVGVITVAEAHSSDCAYKKVDKITVTIKISIFFITEDLVIGA